MGRKIKIRVFKFTNCNDCQAEILKQKEKFSELKNTLDFKFEPEKIEKAEIAFVQGSISKEQEIKKLEKIRKNSRYLIALGSCSLFGSAISRITGKKIIAFTPVVKYVKVDYALRGCPIIGSEFFEVIKNFIAGKIKRDPEIPVCRECKARHLQCLIKNGKFCAGPITYAGCKAICLKNNAPCIGCRGIMRDANLKSWVKKMRENGFEKEALKILEIFNRKP